MYKKDLFQGIKACIFDLDGTLVDSLRIWKDIDIRFFQEHQREVPPDYDKRIAHMNFMEMAVFTKEEYGFQETPEEIAKIWTDWSEEAYQKTIKAKPGAKELLSYIKELPLPISLATTNKRELYEPCLKNNQMWQYFDYSMNVNEINSKKSEPKIYLLLAEKMNVKPEECLVFEDIYTAVKTAHDAGFKVAAVFDEGNLDDMDKIKESSDFFIQSYSDLK
jgi:HAD hydrolase, family IA, variant 3